MDCCPTSDSPPPQRDKPTGAPLGDENNSPQTPSRVRILTTLWVFSDDENSRPASKRPKQGETAERVICHLRCSVERAVVTGGAARLAHARRCPRRLDPRARSDEPEREISSCRRGKFWRLLHRKLTEERRAAPSRPRERWMRAEADRVRYTGRCGMCDRHHTHNFWAGSRRSRRTCFSRQSFSSMRPPASSVPLGTAQLSNPTEQRASATHHHGLCRWG